MLKVQMHRTRHKISDLAGWSEWSKWEEGFGKTDDPTFEIEIDNREFVPASEWQPMDTAPLDGKHCILSVQEGAFIVSVQGFYHGGKWIAVHRDNVQPLAWMPNVLLPEALCPPSFRNDALNKSGVRGE